MSIIQGLIASISKSAGGGTPLPAGVIDTGITLSGNWTIQMVTTIEPAQYWATLWGNEIYNFNQGYLAYLNSPSGLSVGSPSGADYYQLTDNINTKAHWAFVHTDGSGISVYRNSVLLTPSGSGFAEPSSQPTNTLLLYGRHQNDGTGATDLCAGTHDWYNVDPLAAQDAATIASTYTMLQSSYGI